MNSIKQITSGLTSSLLLAAGLTRLAEKTDPMLSQAKNSAGAILSAEACENCSYPCLFTPTAGE